MELTEEEKEILKEKQEKLDKFLKEIGGKLEVAMTFPRYNIYPDDLKLALLLIQKHEGRLDVKLVEDKKDKEKKEVKK